MSAAQNSEQKDNSESGEVNEVRLKNLRECILNLEEPVAKRTHAAFHLRTLGSVSAMWAIADALKKREDSSLMRHELAYILGQMQHPECCETLSDILKDESEDVLVRHESAESLGAIGKIEYLEVLQSFTNHSAPEIAETCQIAVDLMNYRHKENEGKVESKDQFLSVNPAPAFKDERGVEELKKDLMDSSLSLFVRYRVMFSLRNINDDESALALVEGLKDSSALFRHEVAYVLGQLMRKVTIPGLKESLLNKDEHRMVRHEAAEALGAIGGEEAEEILLLVKDDPEVVVVDSVQVALDTIDYWSTF